MFRNAVPDEPFRGLEIRSYRIPDSNYDLKNANVNNFTKVVMYKIFVDTPHTWALPFVTGYQYSIHFQNGNLDFNHLNLYPTNYWKSDDKGIVLRFNYSEINEDFNTTLLKFRGNFVKGIKSTDYLNPADNDFFIGDYYHDPIKKVVFVGINGKSNGSIDIDPVSCLHDCNKNQPLINVIPKETFTRLWSNVSMWNNSRLPKDNEEVYIPSNWNVVLDVNSSNLSRIIIDGDLSFDPKKPNLQLTAGIIWVRTGNLIAGSPSNPIQNKIKIVITGNRESPMLLIDPYLDSSNKLLAVTGSLRLYGSTPNRIWTKLYSSGFVGDSQITLLDAVDWSRGDEIVIAPTEYGYTEHEKMTIVSISADKKTLTLDSPLKFFHYGDTNYTYSSSFGQILDMRAAVGLLTRKIQITTDADQNWGLNILIYQFTDMTQTVRRGYTELVGVEISNGGQPDTERAALDIKYIKSNGNLSLIQNSSIHNGLGWCSHVYSSINVTFDNNVLYNCEKFLTRALFSNYFTYTNNLLIAPRERDLNRASDLYDMVAGLDMYQSVNNAKYKITKNWVQGSEGNGFVMSGTGCGDASGFKDNQVISTKYVGLIVAKNNSRCLEATDIAIAKTEVGVLSNFDAAGFNLKRMILAENKIGTQVMFGRENDDNAFGYENMVFIAVARTNCSFCYIKKDSCSHTQAIFNPITVILGKAIPIDKPTPLGLVGVCKDAAFDQKLLMKDCLFINYKLDYSKDNNNNLKNCTNNIVFQMRGDPDAQSNAYLTNTKTINTDFNALANLIEPNQAFMFWRGGCGDFLCTGEKNWILTDTDGSFLGEIGQIIPNNSNISLVNTGCTPNTKWNGRFCKGIRFGTLEFQNDGADQRKRIIAPLTIYSANMKTVINQWREWKWEGPEPLDQRLARFAGIIELNNTMDLSFEVTVPEELKFKLQKGRKEVDYVIIKIKYERPNIIEVWNVINGTFMKPYRVSDNVDLKTKIDQCGANIYDPDNYTIQFVLNNRDDCKLKVRTIDAVRVTIRMDSTIDDFYSNNGEADFIDKIATFLKIDPSRIRIVNVLKGSVIVNFQIADNVELKPSTLATETEDEQIDYINGPPNISPPPMMTFSPYTSSASSESTPTFISPEQQAVNEKTAQLQSLIENLEKGLGSGEFNLMSDFNSIDSTIVVHSANLKTNSTTRHFHKNKTAPIQDIGKNSSETNKSQQKKDNDKKRNLNVFVNENIEGNFFTENIYIRFLLIAVFLTIFAITSVFLYRKIRMIKKIHNSKAFNGNLLSQNQASNEIL